MHEMSGGILLCSQDPLLTKHLYGPLRDAGWQVETIEHSAEAIKCILKKNYLAVILDPTDAGLDVKEAAAIIKSLNSDIHIIVLGEQDSAADVCCIRKTAEDMTCLIEYINKLSLLRAHARP